MQCNPYLQYSAYLFNNNTKENYIKNLQKYFLQCIIFHESDLTFKMKNDYLQPYIIFMEITSCVIKYNLYAF